MSDEPPITTQPLPNDKIDPTEVDALNEINQEEKERERKRRDDCCCSPDPTYEDECYGLLACIRWFFHCIGECTDSCCDGCADCLSDCCENNSTEDAGGNCCSGESGNDYVGESGNGDVGECDADCCDCFSD